MILHIIMRIPESKEYWMNCYNGINYTNNVLFGINKVQTGDHPMDRESIIVWKVKQCSYVPTIT